MFKGSQSEYPYGNLIFGLADAGFAPLFQTDDIAVRIRKLMGQDSIVKEEMLALLAFLFDEYEEFYEAVLKYRIPIFLPWGLMRYWRILIQS